jgi:hypothetical protein
MSDEQPEGRPAPVSTPFNRVRVAILLGRPVSGSNIMEVKKTLKGRKGHRNDRGLEGLFDQQVHERLPPPQLQHLPPSPLIEVEDERSYPHSSRRIPSQRQLQTSREMTPRKWKPPTLL